MDALAAEYGGIRTYVDNLLATWAAVHPEDELLVVVPQGLDLPTHGHDRHELRLRGPAALARPMAQTRSLPGIARAFRADALLATMPSTALVRVGVPTAVVVHDLRHELRPEQFSRARRLVRAVSYGRAYALADGFVAVSGRTLDDLHRLHPSTRSRPGVVVHHGADHVRDWPGTPGSGPAVAFAHHSNKNPGLVVDAWADARRRGLALPDLLVLGAGSVRQRLEDRVSASGLDGRVRVASYLPDEEFRRAFASAAAVVFPSDFEGFGLPVLEGMLLGIPVVAGPDPAVVEVAGGHAVVMQDWTPTALAEAVAAAMELPPGALATARDHAAGFTWARSVEQTRELLAGLSPRSRRRRRSARASGG